MKMIDIKYTLVDYQDLFEFAYKLRGWRWGKCHFMFLGKRLLKYEGESDIFWRDDIESDMENSDWSGSRDYKGALEVVGDFLLDKSIDGVKFIHY